jgi:hypothetical protein
MLPLQYAELGNVVADPISVVLVAFGAVLVGAPSLAFGYLSMRGLVAAVTPE